MAPPAMANDAIVAAIRDRFLERVFMWGFSFLGCDALVVFTTSSNGVCMYK